MNAFIICDDKLFLNVELHGANVLSACTDFRTQFYLIKYCHEWTILILKWFNNINICKKNVPRKLLVIFLRSSFSIGLLQKKSSLANKSSRYFHVLSSDKIFTNTSVLSFILPLKPLTKPCFLKTRLKPVDFQTPLKCKHADAALYVVCL